MITDLFESSRSKLAMFKKSIDEIDSLPILQEDKDHIKESITIAFKEDLRKLDTYKTINSSKDLHFRKIMNAFVEILDIKLTSLTDHGIINSYKNLCIIDAILQGKEYSFLQGEIQSIVSKYTSEVNFLKTNYSSEILAVSRYNGKLTTAERENISKIIYDTSIFCISIIQFIFSDDRVIEELALCDFDKIKEIKEELLNE